MIFIKGLAGAKWQSERMYTEQDMIEFGEKMQIIMDVDFDGNVEFAFDPKEAIKEFKKKQLTVFLLREK